MSYDRDKLVRQVFSDATSLNLIDHGPKHWMKVAQNGIMLARKEGVDTLFCEIFGLLHDCQRLDDYGDKQHGARAAQYARSIGTLIPLSPREFKDLLYALTWHDNRTHTKNIQIGCCWDADRLELPRVGVITDPRMLNTDTAKKIARDRIRRMR